MRASDQKRVVLVDVPTAKAVFVLGPFNNWSTTATPMRWRPEDGIWEAAVPAATEDEMMALCVWWPGQLGGYLYNHDAVIERPDPADRRPPPSTSEYLRFRSPATVDCSARLSQRRVVSATARRASGTHIT